MAFLMPAPRLLLVVSLVGTTACKKPSDTGEMPWREKKTSQLVFGPHTIAIPPGWRDWSELDNNEIPLGPGFVAMTPEKIADGAGRSNIVLGWVAYPANSIDPRNPPCAELAAMVAKEYKSTASDIARIAVDGDAGCRSTYANSDARVLQRVRFQGDHQLVVQWTRMSTLGNADAGGDKRVWQDVLSKLHFPAD